MNYETVILAIIELKIYQESMFTCRLTSHKVCPSNPDSKPFYFCTTLFPMRWNGIIYGPTKPAYLLFVGGADRRRKLEDLVTAFNQLRAQGHELKLILAGDTMQGPANVATEEIQYALKTSSYLKDIIFMGFANDATRDWLY